MRLLLDQNVSASAAELLLSDGWDVVHGSAVTVTPTSIRVRALPLMGKER